MSKGDWDDPDRWYGEGGGRGVQDWEHVYTHGGCMQNRYSKKKKERKREKKKEKDALQHSGSEIPRNYQGLYQTQAKSSVRCPFSLSTCNLTSMTTYYDYLLGEEQSLLGILMFLPESSAQLSSATEVFSEVLLR